MALHFSSSFPTSNALPQRDEGDSDLGGNGFSLQEISDTKLPSYLYLIHRQLRCTPVIPYAGKTSDVSAVGISSLLALDSTFIDALLSSRFLCSTSTEVVQLTGCILCDWIRLTVPSAGVCAKGSVSSLTSFPFPLSKSIEVLRCITQPVREALRFSNLPAQAGLIIERASTCGVIGALVPHCNPEEVEPLVHSFFELLQTPLLAQPSCSTSALSTSLSVNLSLILLDVIHACNNSISPDQLSILLSAVVKGSPSLQKKGPFSESQFSSIELSAPNPSTKYNTATFNAVTAGRVLSECVTIVQESLNEIVMRQIAEALSGLDGEYSISGTLQLSVSMIEKDSALCSSSCITEGPFLPSTAHEEERALPEGLKNSASRRLYLFQISRCLEYFVAMAELHVDLVQRLLPNLQTLLGHSDADFRRLLLRGLGMGYASQPQVVPTFRSCFESFLEHLEDEKAQIRVDMLQFVETIVGKAKKQWLGCSPWGDVECTLTITGQHSSSDRKSVELGTWDLWKVLLSPVKQRLLDPNSCVRQQAVITLANCVENSPELILRADLDLEHSLGLRSADKNSKVRDTSLERLCKLYRTSPEQFKWVPGNLFSLPPMEEGVKVIEIMLENLLLPVLDSKEVSVDCESLSQPHKRTFPFNAEEGFPSIAEGTYAKKNEESGSQQRKVLPYGVVDPKIDHLFLPSTKAQLFDHQSYLQNWFRLCSNISPSHFHELLRIAKRKSLLRTTVSKLFELREEVTQRGIQGNMDAEVSGAETKSTIKTDGSAKQRAVHSIHRLLVFLRAATGAKKNQWDTLFRCKDRKVVQAILHFCDHVNEEWESERLELLNVLKGRVDADTYAFIKYRLLMMLSFPLQLQHVSALVKYLRCIHSRSDTNTIHKGVTPLDGAGIKPNYPPIPSSVMVRVLRVFLLASPSYHRRCMSPITDIFCQLLTDPDMHEEKSPSCISRFSDSLASVESLLHCLRELPSALQQLSTKAEQSVPASLYRVLLDSQKSVLFEVLKAICNGNSPLLCYPGGKMNSAVLKKDDLKLLCSICKNAAICLLSLMDILHSVAKSEDDGSAHGNATKPVSVPLGNEIVSDLQEMVLQHVQHSIHNIRHEGAKRVEEILSTSAIPFMAWLQALRVFNLKNSLLSSKSIASISAVPSVPPSEQNVSCPSIAGLQQDVGDVLLTFCSLYGHYLARGEGQQTNWSIRRQKQESKFSSSIDVLVDCAAKTLSAVTLAKNASDRGDRVRDALGLLLEAARVLRNVERDTATKSSSNRSCIRREINESTRIAILQQLVKLVRFPSSDMVKEIGVAVVFSSEESPSVRRVLQEKFVSHSLHSICDMRYIAHLLLFAIPATNRSEYQELRLTLRKVGNHLRKKQLGGDSGFPISLSSPAAMGCYMEYAIPFLILFLSRHPKYEIQKEKLHFIAFQRVWHLLFEEILRHGVQCVGFVKELFFRIKQAKDALDPEGFRTKVLCDLGSSVFEQVLSQHEIGTDALKRYPGVVLLPNFFISPSPGESNISLGAVAQTNYLDSHLYLPAHVPFRLPPSCPSTSPSLSVIDNIDNDPATISLAANSGKRGREDSLGIENKKLGKVFVSGDSSLFRSGNSSSLIERTKEKVNKELFDVLYRQTAGLEKSEIAQIRWKELRNEVENLPSLQLYVNTITQEEEGKNSAGNKKSPLSSALEDLLDSAKTILRDLYSQAKN